MNLQPIEDIPVLRPDVAAVLVLFKTTIAGSLRVIAGWQRRADEHRHRPRHLHAIICHWVVSKAVTKVFHFLVLPRLL